jgi:hypothetical protein
MRRGRCVEGVASSVVSLHGRYADIAVVGRDPSGEEGAYDRTMPTT